MFLTESRLSFRGIRPLQKLGATARSLTFGNPLAGLALAAKKVPDQLRAVPPDPWPGDARRGRDMIAGVFSFAGQTIAKENLSWNPPAAIAEWKAGIQSFEWLRDLRSVGGERARRMAREMVAGWIAQHQKYDAFAWRPDLVGLRIKAWISFHDFFCASADDEFRRNYFAALMRQAAYLAKTLPNGAAGLPLVQALKGLAYAGLALDDGEGWLTQALDALSFQIREQILPDGGHVSRSPQAAFEFLQCLVDLRAALIASRREMPEALQDAIDRLAPAVKFFRHGDGAFAQFNGGGCGNAHLCDTTLMHSGARGRAPVSLPNTGYERLTRGRASLIMDTGLPLTSAWCERAHAGLLSFEYGFGRERVIVNCGTSGVDGKWRKVLRSTPAHSTLTADNRNACDFDDEGRLIARPAVRARRHEDAEISLLEASHNGYAQHLGLTHRRCLRLSENGDVLAGEDQLTGKAGVPFAVRFHLHPGIEAMAGQNGEILLTSRAGMTWTFRAAGADVSVEESICFGRDEQPEAGCQIVLTGRTADASALVGWELRRIGD